MISATHVDLEEALRAGRFREDLLGRLNVLKIELPPLRDRGNDVVLLAKRFLAGAEPPRDLDEAACDALRRHAWPRNVRELQNVIQVALLDASGPLIGADDLDLSPSPGAGGGTAFGTLSNKYRSGWSKSATDDEVTALLDAYVAALDAMPVSLPSDRKGVRRCLRNATRRIGGQSLRDFWRHLGHLHERDPAAVARRFAEIHRSRPELLPLLWSARTESEKDEGNLPDWVELQNEIEAPALREPKSTEVVSVISVATALTDPMARPRRIGHNLPRRPSVFVGRERELESLLNVLAGRDFRVTITGVGGVGKTALALEAAWRCAEGRVPEELRPQLTFDAIVWTSAKQRVLDDGVVRQRHEVQSNVEGIVHAIVEAISPSDLKRDFDEKFRRAKVVLADQRVLLVIDNKETIDDPRLDDFVLEHFPDPSKLIITDRRAFDASRQVALAPLSADDAVALVDDASRDLEPPLTSEQKRLIAERTGGIAVAIQWVVARMRTTGHPPERMLELVVSSRGVDVLGYLFDASWRELERRSPAGVRIMQALAVTNVASLGSELASWVGLDEGSAEDALAEIRQLALAVEQVPDTAERPSRSQYAYSLLSLTRAYVLQREYDRETLRQAVVRSCLEHLRRTVASPLRPTLEAIQWINARRELVQWAFEDARSRDDQRSAVDLALYAANALHQKGHNGLVMRLGKLAFDDAERLGDEAAMARLLVTCVAWIAFQWHQYEECERAVRRGLDLAQRSGDDLSRKLAVRTMGLIEKERGNIEEADRWLDLARTQLRPEGDEGRFLSLTLRSLAALARDRRCYDEALALLDEQAALDRTLGADDLETQEIHFATRCEILLLCGGRMEEAAAANTSAKEYNARLDRPLGRAYIQRNEVLIAEQTAEGASTIAERRRQLERAIELAQGAAQMFERQSNRREMDRIIARLVEKLDDDAARD